MDRKFIGCSIAVLSIFFIAVIVGVGLYFFGTSLYVALSTDSLLCCLLPIVIVGAVLWFLALMKDVWFTGPEV